MKKRISIYLSIVLLVCSLHPLSANAKNGLKFGDISPNAWYYNAVEYAVSNGLFSGTSATTFSPNTPMTRGMFITVLGRIHGVGENYGQAKPSYFSDVPASHYCHPYAVWAQDNGMVFRGIFRPDEPIMREEMAVIFHLYFQEFGFPLVERQSPYSSFSDSAAVAPTARAAVKWATAYNILNGPGGKLNPKAPATRAQVAQIFLNFSGLKSYAANTAPEPTAPPWHNYNPVYEIPTGRSAADASGGYFDYDLANEVMKQINKIRADSGHNELKYHPLVAKWAGIRAIESQVRADHIRPDGSKCITVGEGLNQENLYMGVNYPAYFRDNTPAMAAQIVRCWVESTGHFKNMLNNCMDVAAVACYVKGNNVYACHLFSSRPPYFFDYDLYDIYGWSRDR